MPISANTLFHFTSTDTALKGILRDNFRLKYCRESIMLGTRTGGYAAPMVSFCDIPLSQVKQHIASYGSYGLGLTKAWAVKAGLNPVLYISAKSGLAESYHRAFKHFASRRGANAEWTDDQKALVDILRYFKNDEGKLERQGKVVKNYRFSDEREWRYLPSYSSPCNMALSLSQFDDDETKSAAASSISTMRLEFHPDDIKYIIIKCDEEISEFVNHLRDSKGKRYTHAEVERLTTRIITVEQVLGDM